MTDKEKLLALLNEWGVPHKEQPSGDKDVTEIVVARGYDVPEHPKVSGYMGFYTVFAFSPQGNFECMGAWE